MPNRYSITVHLFRLFLLSSQSFSMPFHRRIDSNRDYTITDKKHYFNEKYIMHYPSLGQQQLSRFSYHWFWGLRVNQNATQTLYDDAVYLQNHPNKTTQFIDQLKDISQSIWIVRAFYWIFNINQYRVNYYKFCAYVSLSIYQDEMSKMSENKQLEMVSGFLMLVTASALITNLAEPLGPGVSNRLINWFKRDLEPFLSDNIPLYSPNLLEEPHSSYDSIQIIFTQNTNDDKTQNQSIPKQQQFIATNQTIKPLKLLGLSLKAGDYISLVDLKKAYREKLLLTHPDKTGIDSKKECLDVMAAYNDVIRTITMKSGSYYETEQTKYPSTFDELVKQEMMEWMELRKEVDKYCVKVSAHSENLSAYNASLSAHSENLSRYSESLSLCIEKCRVYEEISREVAEIESRLSNKFFRIIFGQNKFNADHGLPPVTDEEVQAFMNDPDYFEKKNKGLDNLEHTDAPINKSMSL